MIIKKLKVKSKFKKKANKFVHKLQHLMVSHEYKSVNTREKIPFGKQFTFAETYNTNQSKCKV